MATIATAARRPALPAMVRPVRVLQRVALHALVVLVCAWVLFPVYWMLVTSLRPARRR